MNRKIVYIITPIIIVLIFYINPNNVFVWDSTLGNYGNLKLFCSIVISCFIIEYFINKAKAGSKLYMRPIAGIEALEEAVGRSTEMGKPVLYIPGIDGLDEINTISGLSILGHVAGMTSKYETKLHVPVRIPIVMEAARETCREAYSKSGRPDIFKEDMVHFVSDEQFAYAAGVNGIILRDKPAAIFYQGGFYAESLLLAETGNSIGSIQVAGTGSSHQIPFFVTACDYTLIAEEFYAASAYLSKEPDLIGSIKGQDYMKIICFIAIFVVIVSPFLFSSPIVLLTMPLLSAFLFILIFNGSDL